MARFSALPTWWVRELTMGAFLGGGQAGTSIAALKVLMAISSLMDFYSRKAKSSFSDLEKLTGLSRPMVLKGISVLEGLAIVVVDRTGHVNQYELTVKEDDRAWAKLPTDRVRLRMPELSNRGIVPLAALKIYLMLVALRPNTSTSLSISHENLRNYTGVQKKHIRPALDILYSHSLIRLSLVEENSKGRHNLYTLQGITV